MAKFRRKASASAAEPCWDTILQWGTHASRSMGGEHVPTPSASQIAAEWEARRDRLMQEFIRENPRTRPWAHWRFDRPGVHHWPLFVEPIPSAPWGREPPPRDQSAYLRQHGLLTPAEMAHAPPWDIDHVLPSPLAESDNPTTAPSGP